MFIYKFIHEGTGADFIIAPNKPAARKFYKDLIDCDLDGVEVERLRREEWHRHYILDLDDIEMEGGDPRYYYCIRNGGCLGYRIIRTFEGAACLHVSEYGDRPDIICTTMF